MLIDDRIGEPGRNAIIFATCQGWVVRMGLVVHVPFFGANAAVHFYPSWVEDISPILDKAPECNFLFFQPESDPGVLARFSAIRDRMPASAQIIRFPTIGFTPYWPYLIRDWAAPVDPALGAPRFPFGDRRIVALLRAGVPQSRVVREYLSFDIPAAVDLDRLYEVWRISARAHEEECDAGVSDLVDELVRDKMLFFSAYHCSNLPVLKALDRTLQKLGLTGLDPAAYEAGDLLCDYEMPIHPSVIRHFGIKYLAEDYKYKTLWGARASFEEYYEAYVDYLAATDRRAHADVAGA
jgi:hypothetical protein